MWTSSKLFALRASVLFRCQSPVVPVVLPSEDFFALARVFFPMALKYSPFCRQSVLGGMQKFKWGFAGSGSNVEE